MKTSHEGIEEIKKSEGLRLKPYLDIGGLGTIGYGHLIRKGEMFHEITQEEAETLLKEDIIKAEAAVNRYIDLTKTNQFQYDALVSFAFNLGGGCLNGTSIQKFHNAGQIAKASAQFTRWVYVDGKVSNGLLQRRKREQAWYRRIV